MKRKNKLKPIAITAGAFVLLIFLHSVGFLDLPEKFIFKTFAPIQAWLYNSRVNSIQIITSFKHRQNYAEIELLKAQIRSLLVQNAKLKLLSEENKLLKKELGVVSGEKYALAHASIIGYDSLQNSTTLILKLEDKTDIKELSLNMPIIIEDGILVGKISAIDKDKIYMRLLSSSRSAVAASILNNSSTIGLVEGELNIGVKISMIPQSEKIKAGDLIITSGLESEMPRGILIGTVSKIASENQGPFFSAHITPLYDFRRLSRVMIIKEY